MLQRVPSTVNLGFPDRTRYISFQVALRSFSGNWVDPVPESLLLRKSVSTGNRTRYLWNCSQELWLLDHREHCTFNRQDSYRLWFQEDARSSHSEILP
jgi:hypothetical protein